MSKRSGGPEESWGAHSVEKRGPERTRGVLRGLHGPEMPLGKKGEIWRDCKETRGCLTGLEAQKRAGGPILWKRGVQSTLEGYCFPQSGTVALFWSPGLLDSL